ncbi:MAG: UDP-glucose 4-epimerase [Actinomycetota bacterium]|nr:UDP-glucose 4-epimerase [Actinomycetota bacterium]
MTAPSALITGGCGFIGVNLARLLSERGWRLVAFDNLSTGSAADAEAAGFGDLIVGDVADRDGLAAAIAGCDHVVHLAAQTGVVPSVADPLADLEANVRGTVNALLGARQANVRHFVLASSNAPLGGAEPPARETAVPRPSSPYGASKLAAEGYCSAFAASYGLPTTVLRFANVYGPFSYHKGSVVATFLKAVMAGERCLVYGDGSQTRDFVYVDDLCRGITLALEAGLSGETFQLGTGVATSVLELVDHLRTALAGRSVDVEHLPARPGEIDQNWSDISKARTLLGFEPSVDLPAGLARTAAWFESAYGAVV